MASSSSAGTSSSQSVGQSFTVIVNKKLVSLLGTYKKVNIVSTYAEVLDSLRIYIIEKKLFDPMCPVKIKCCGDELSSVLGVEEFTIHDVRKLLQKHVFPVRINKNRSVEDMPIPSTSSDSATLKRKAEEISDGGIIKKTCDEINEEPMFLHIPPSPPKADSSDAAESIQGYETAFVKDTSDDSWSFFEEESDDELLPGDILAVEETFDVEYEIESDSDEEVNTCVSESGSDLEGVGNSVISFVCNPDSDQEFWADKSSDEEYDSDLEIPDSDKWKCKRCNSFNNPPMRYCIKCWYMRSGWVMPNRTERRAPPRRKLRRRQSKKIGKLLDSEKEKPNSAKPFTSALSTQLSSTTISYPVNSFQQSPEALAHTDQLPIISSDTSNSSHELSMKSPTILIGLPSSMPSIYTQKTSFSSSENSSSVHELSTVSNSSSQEFPSASPYSSSQEFPSTGDSQELPSTSKDVISSLNNFRTLNLSNVPKFDSEKKLCLLCCSSPANASIIHGKYAHQISCYRCARKLQLDNKRCPVCRRVIDRVVYQIAAI